MSENEAPSPRDCTPGEDALVTASAYDIAPGERGRDERRAAAGRLEFEGAGGIAREEGESTGAFEEEILPAL